MVLFFAAFGLVTVGTYLYHQFTSSKQFLSSPSSLQSLFAARSGVYKAIEELNAPPPDTLPTISAIDSVFGGDLFGLDTSGFGEPLDIDKIQPDGIARQLSPFDNDSFGLCMVSVTPTGNVCALESVGMYRNQIRHVWVTLGSRVPAGYDTVLILGNNDPLTGLPPRGTVIYSKNKKTDTLGVKTAGNGNRDIATFLTHYQEQLTNEYDSSLFLEPLAIQEQDELDQLPQTVQGDLLIDGSFFDLTLHSDETIVVWGDLQITGTVTIKNTNFIVGGEIKILDEAKLENSSLFTLTRLFIGGQAEFNGNALAQGSIIVYGRAIVKDKSMLVVSGSGGTSTGSSSAQDSASTKSKGTKHFSIYLSESSTIDATVIALGSPGGIKTEDDVFVSGVLWAEKSICHQGKMTGLIRADRLIDCSGTPSVLTGGGSKSGGSNSMDGELEPLLSINEYPMPYYVGTLSILEWKED